jgi:hypothetical protein
MFFGLFGIIIKGSMNVGGFGEVWRRAYVGGRVEFFE